MMLEQITEYFAQLHPIKAAFLAGLFTWTLTAIGAGLVFFFKTSNRKFLDASLGFTGGVMIAASFWSLLSPAIATVEKQQELGITDLPIWFAPAIGFLLGALFLYFLDKKVPHLHLFESVENAEGPKTDLKKRDCRWFLSNTVWPKVWLPPHYAGRYRKEVGSSWIHSGDLLVLFESQFLLFEAFPMLP